MRLLVTGGAGFIGSNFIRQWMAAHSDGAVMNVDLLTYAGDRTSLVDVERSAPDRYRFERADIADLDAVDRLVAEWLPDAIVNFAAESHNSRGVQDPSAFVRTNVLGTQTLLEVARRRAIGRVHHVSTCEVYGDLALDSRESFSESSPRRPNTPYSASKASADLIALAFHRTYGIGLTISTCSNNYGPFQHPEKAIPLFVTNALQGRPLPLYRHSENRREWIHVLDHCRAIDVIVSKGTPGETYNVGTGEERSIEQIADAILEATGASPNLKQYVDDRPGHDRRYLLDSSKIRRELGWAPRIGFDRGLRETVEWYRTNQEWWMTKKAHVPDEFAWSPASAGPRS